MRDIELIDMQGIADLLDVQVQTVRVWRHREVIPSEEWTLAGGPIWRLETILAWGADRPSLSPEVRRRLKARLRRRQQRT